MKDLVVNHQEFLPLYKDILSTMKQLNGIYASRNVQIELLEKFIDALETNNTKDASQLEPLVYESLLKNIKNFKVS
jgi:hypothetical protein